MDRELMEVLMDIRERLVRIETRLDEMEKRLSRVERRNGTVYKVFMGLGVVIGFLSGLAMVLFR